MSCVSVGGQSYNVISVEMILFSESISKKWTFLEISLLITTNHYLFKTSDLKVQNTSSSCCHQHCCLPEDTIIFQHNSFSLRWHYSINQDYYQFLIQIGKGSSFIEGLLYCLSMGEKRFPLSHQISVRVIKIQCWMENQWVFNFDAIWHT